MEKYNGLGYTGLIECGNNMNKLNKENHEFLISLSKLNGEISNSNSCRYNSDIREEINILVIRHYMKLLGCKETYFNVIRPVPNEITGYVIKYEIDRNILVTIISDYFEFGQLEIDIQDKINNKIFCQLMLRPTDITFDGKNGTGVKILFKKILFSYKNIYERWNKSIELKNI
jgi:hypothetical protein